MNIQETKLANARKTFNVGKIVIYAGAALTAVGLLTERPQLIDDPSFLKAAAETAAANKIAASGVIAQWVGMLPLIGGWYKREKAKKALGLRR